MPRAVKAEPVNGPYARMAAENHTQYYCATARAGGGEIVRLPGCLWTYEGPEGDAMVLFPRLAEEVADGALDEMLAWYCERGHSTLIGCWSLDPPAPTDLGARLLARGFQPGWHPQWMGRALADLTDLPSPPVDVRIREVHDRKAAPRARSRRRCFEAVRNGQVIGHSTLFLSTGRYAAAGIYDVGVLPAERNRGVGRAVTAAAMLKARALGAQHAVLNATGRRMYEQLGFAAAGLGNTWWLNVPRLQADRPSPERIALAEAVGRGDIAQLNTLFASGGAAILAIPITCGLTLLELAAHEARPEAAIWLLEHGAPPDVMSLWDLGLRTEAVHLLATRPDAAGWPAGELQATPLHLAAERNDVELASLLLGAEPDLALEDAAFGSTAEGWARHFKRRKILGMIRAARRER